MAKHLFSTKVKNQITRNLQDYLVHFKFNQGFKLLSELPVEFNWINSRLLIENIRYQIKTNDDFLVEKIKAQDFINSLKKVPLWIEKQGHIIPMSMYDVYFTLFQFIKKGTMEDELYNVYQTSFMGPSGPFKKVSLIDCVNDQTLNYFIQWQVMINKLPQRSFRLNTQGQVKIEYQNQKEHTYTELLKVEQLTDIGVLFSSENEQLLLDLDQVKTLKIFFDSQALIEKFNSHEKIENTPLYYTENELKYFNIDQGKIIKHLKYDSHQNGKFFLFCRYCDMQESDVPFHLKQLTREIKDVFTQAVA